MNIRQRMVGCVMTFAAALLGVLVAEYLINRFDVLSPFYPSALNDEYTNVVLQASKVVEPAGVYVQYRNTGTNTIVAANFKLKYYEKGQLVEESGESYWEEVRGGAGTEGIIIPQRLSRDNQLIPIPLKGRAVKIICTGGYTKED